MRNNRIHSTPEAYRLLSVVPTLVAIKADNGWTDEQIEEWSATIAALTWKDEHSNSRRFWMACEKVIGPFRHP